VPIGETIQTVLGSLSQIVCRLDCPALCCNALRLSPLLDFIWPQIRGSGHSSSNFNITWMGSDAEVVPCYPLNSICERYELQRQCRSAGHSSARLKGALSTLMGRPENPERVSHIMFTISRASHVSAVSFYESKTTGRVA
jgi:hypothetical protein